jgi:hypothetical protein
MSGVQQICTHSDVNCLHVKRFLTEAMKLHNRTDDCRCAYVSRD